MLPRTYDILLNRGKYLLLVWLYLKELNITVAWKEQWQSAWFLEWDTGVKHHKGGHRTLTLLVPNHVLIYKYIRALTSAWCISNQWYLPPLGPAMLNPLLPKGLKTPWAWTCMGGQMVRNLESLILSVMSEFL